MDPLVDRHCPTEEHLGPIKPVRIMEQHREVMEVSGDVGVVLALVLFDHGPGPIDQRRGLLDPPLPDEEDAQGC